MQKPLFVFLLLSGFSLKNASKFKPKWPPKNQHNMMPLRTQIHTKIRRNSMILAPKHAKLRPKCDFWGCFVLDDFLNIIFQLFWQHLILKWGPEQKKLSNFCVHFGSQRSFFEAIAFFYRLWSQKYRQNAKIRVWLLGNPMEFVTNVIESPMPGSPIFPI